MAGTGWEVWEARGLILFLSASLVLMQSRAKCSNLLRCCERVKMRAQESQWSNFFFNFFFNVYFIFGTERDRA